MLSTKIHSGQHASVASYVYSNFRKGKFLKSVRHLNSNKISIFSADWVCQVSPSSFDADDALSSRSARLIVRIPPMAPRIYYDGQFLNTEVSSIDNGNFPVTDLQRCVKIFTRQLSV